MKVTNSAEKITPFGGFNFVFKSFKDSGLPGLIDKELGMRVKTFGFSYSDIFTNHMAVYFNGGDCAEDINDHLRGHLQSVRGMGVCSADTILRGIKELATDTLCFDNLDSGARHGFNLNPKLNGLMAKALKQTGCMTWTMTTRSSPQRNTMPKRLTKRHTATSPGLPPSTICRYT